MRANALFLALAAAAAAPCARADVILWHTLERRQRRILDGLVAEFNAASGGARVRTETGMELPQALIEALADGAPPDAVLAPADLIGLAAELGLSPVPEALADVGAAADAGIRATVTAHGRAYGAPVLDGNHLLLLYNRRLAPRPATSLEAMAAPQAAPAARSRRSGPQVAWLFEEPYLFTAFLPAFGAEPTAYAANAPLRTALARYAGLARAGLVARDCGYDCVTTAFYRGDYAYAIDGEWALLDAEAALGADLGIAPLPTLGGRPLVSYSTTQALMFPANALAGPRRAVLLAFTRFLQGAVAQRRWLAQGHRLPVLPALRREVAAGRTPLAPAVLAQLTATRRLPATRAMALAWSVLRKGLRLYLDGVQDADQVCRYMQTLADADAPGG